MVIKWPLILPAHLLKSQHDSQASGAPEMFMTPPQACLPPPDIKKSGATRRLDVHMSPPAKKQKRHVPERATLYMQRTPPPETYRPEPELPDCHFYGTSKRRSPRKNLRLK